jgi:2-keto-4-pentenoate hydratase/2-oxohepta-3-ene-1,7-dioic acid hydratase in catechol pathway
MKIARFSTGPAGGDPRYGILDGTDLVVLAGDPLFSGFDTLDERVPITEVRLLAPVIPRSKVIAIGRNYAAHAAEFGNDVPDEPMMFLKPNTSVIGPGDAIVLPSQSSHVDFEGELAVVIGSVARNVRESDAASVIFGYTIGNDVSARDLQKKDGQWGRAKGFDTFCPLGPVIQTELDLGTESIESRLNGEVRQSAPFTELVHSVASLVAFASSVFTLLPGDVILTGTPAGVGQLADGDTIEISVPGIGTLRNPVRAG